ncbi:MAG: bifunctional metallophosphatase/5'-nucleotidase [Elusimicrobia bacterium]|nr:bifunctional metallophosphatase/5'-nucleotidase [Elusimicrobiota bacterium]
MRGIKFFRFVFYCLFLTLHASLFTLHAEKLVIYHTNDIHGYISPREASFHKENPKRLIGGFAVLAQIVRQEKGPYLLLDSGDLFFGSPEGNLTNGEGVLEAANALGYDAVAVGNHEFDFGEKRLLALSKKLKAPLLAANIMKRYVKKEEPSRPEYATPYIIKEKEGVKVGIIGLITQNTPVLTLPRHVRRLKFLRPVNSAKELAGRLRREEECDLIILLTHIGFAKEGEDFEDDRYLARQVPGIDLILGGHSHTRLTSAYQEPKNKTIIVQSGSYLSALDKLELTLDPKTKKIKKFEHRLIDLWVDEIGQDPKILRLIEPYKNKVNQQLSRVIGRTQGELSHARGEDSILGNLIADAMKEQAQADIAMHNTGGIRSAIPVGEISLRHLYTAFPFDNTVVVLELTGGQIKEILENSLTEQKKRMYVSGLSLRYRSSRPKGHRIADISIGGKPLLVTKNYTVATNSFLAEGGDGYPTFLRASRKDDLGVLVRDAASQWIAKRSPLNPKSETRLIDLRGN